MRAGRTFSSQDSPPRASPSPMSRWRSACSRGASAVGQRIWIGGAPHDIVGIVADYTHNPMQVPGRASEGLPAARDGAAKNLHQLGVRRPRRGPIPGRSFSRCGARLLKRHRARPSPAPTRSIESAPSGEREVLIGTAPLVPLIAIGTLLTTAGIYGVLAFAITRRSRELAVRMAIGATGRPTWCTS